MFNYCIFEGGNYMEQTQFLKGAGVLLIAALMLLSVSAASANTKTQITSSPTDFAIEMQTQKNNNQETTGFLNDPYSVPAGWDIDGWCIATQDGTEWATHYWAQYDDSNYPLTHSPPYCAGIWWSDGSGGDPVNGEQNEWLISPELDVSSYVTLTLEFYSVYTMNSYGSNPSAHDYIKVSIDEGENWDIVGDLVHDAEFYFEDATGGPGGEGWNWMEYPPTIDLSAYAGEESLLIAFVYESLDGEPSRGIFMVDDVLLTGSGRETILEENFDGEWVDDPDKTYPDLDCEGELSWADVATGGTVEGEFEVINVGQPESWLDWEIADYPEWGTNWTFTPANGQDLTPEDGPFIVKVVLDAPLEEDTEFTGEIKVINSEDAGDYDTISVSLVTPRNKQVSSMQFFLEKLMQRFPFLAQIIA